jgi:hypothetical protein
VDGSPQLLAHSCLYIWHWRLLRVHFLIRPGDCEGTSSMILGHHTSLTSHFLPSSSVVAPTISLTCVNFPVCQSPGSYASLSLADSNSAPERLHLLVGYLRSIRSLRIPSSVYAKLQPHPLHAGPASLRVQCHYLAAGWPLLPHRVFSSPPAHSFSV